MSHIALPRGIDGAIASSMTATAQWSLPHEIARYHYQPGDFFLGAEDQIPADALPIKSDLEKLIAELGAALVFRHDWREAQIEAARAHIRALHTAPQPIGIANDMHIITAAGTRAGKGTTSIIPNLCLYPGSVICIDPKGENARIASARRGAGDDYCEGLGQRLYVLDPYLVSGVDEKFLASWNALDFIDLENSEIYDQAASIAEAIMVRGARENLHFDDNAATLVKALILYVKMTRAGRDDCNLLTVRRLLMQGIRAEPDHDRAPENDEFSPIKALLARMELFEDSEGVIAGAAATLLDMGDKELGSVLSTARRNLEFLEKKPIARVVGHSSFSLDELKTAEQGATIFLCLPVQHMRKVGRWLRLITALTMERMYVLPTIPANGHAVLFLLEEFPVLGHLAVIETAVAYAAGFGVKFHIIIQDLGQLKRHYPKSWETFIGNAGVVQVFANNDTTTLEYISKRIGEIEIVQTNQSATTSQSLSTNDASSHERMQALFANRGALSAFINPIAALSDHSKSSQTFNSSTAHNESRRATRLIRADEIERAFKRETMAQIVLVKGERPMALSRLSYHDAPEFAGLYTPPTTHPANKADLEAERRQNAVAVQEAARQFVTATRTAMASALKRSS